MTSPLVTTTSMHIGPSLSGTIVTKNADMAVAAYLGSLDLQIVSDAPLSSSLATAWGKPSLTRLRLVVLGANPVDANTHRLLGRRLAKGSFTVLGKPRPLAFSNDFVAMQVAGPAGETLDLTEVCAPVPPVNLPKPATLTVERLFILC